MYLQWTFQLKYNNKFSYALQIREKSHQSSK